jgi:hypothetical protein
MTDRSPWAFPHEVTEHDGFHGMSLRDYFAAAIAHEVAERAYQIADAMLRARDQ